MAVLPHFLPPRFLRFHLAVPFDDKVHDIDLLVSKAPPQAPLHRFVGDVATHGRALSCRRAR